MNEDGHVEATVSRDPDPQFQTLATRWAGTALALSALTLRVTIC